MADPQPGPSLTRQIDVFMPLSREAKATTEKSGGVKDDQCLKSTCHCHVCQTLNTHERKTVTVTPLRSPVSLIDKLS
jgi:hypothetical protein